MSDTLEPLRSAKKTQSTPQKQKDSKRGDLQLVAERLALIQGHINQMPPGMCISGVTMRDGFLLVAFKVRGSELKIENDLWLLDGVDVSKY